MSIGENIRKARKARGLTQYELADMLELSQSSIANWEGNRTIPSGENYTKLSQILNVPIENLTGFHVDYISKAKETALYAPVYESIPAGTATEKLVAGDSNLVAIPPELKAKHSHAFFLKVKGTSMNKVLPEGVLALVDPDIPYESGALCALYVGDSEATIKTMTSFSFGVVLSPQSYSDEFTDTMYAYEKVGHDFIAYIGTVVWFMQDYER